MHIQRRFGALLIALTIGTAMVTAGGLTSAQDAAPRPAAATLSRPVSPTKPADSEGFLRRWLVLEPIRTMGQLNDRAVRTLVASAPFPDYLTAIPHDGDVVTAGDTQLTWHAVDTSLYNVNLYHFAYALNKPTSNVMFWAVTVVNAPREMRDVRLAIGSNAASVWWVNGEEVITLFNDRQAVIDDGVSNRLTLKAGPNVIRAVVVNAGGATDFCARLLDANDRPITSLAVALPAKPR